MLRTTMLWVHVEQQGDHWYAYAADFDLTPEGPKNIHEARARARFVGTGETSADARRSLGASVIQALPEMRSFAEVATGSSS
jgi:hypothetical protein